MSLLRKKKNYGFTLIELLVVIAIISLLSSTILSGMKSVRDKAQVSKARSEIRTLHQALYRYFLDNNSWPPTCNNIDTLPKWNDTWKVGYISATVPTDPWGTTYFFDGCPDVECTPGGSSICSPGPNKVYDGSQNRADMTAQGDDICIYFTPEC